MKKLSVLAMLSLATSLVACTTAPNTTTENLAGKTFVSNFVGDTGEAQSITFDTDGKVFGFTGCNRFMGAYTQTGPKLSLDKVAVTRMLCSLEANNAETGFINNLNQTVEVRFDGENLTLVGADGKDLQTLTLKK